MARADLWRTPYQPTQLMAIAFKATTEAGSQIEGVLDWEDDPVMRWAMPTSTSCLEYFPQITNGFGGRSIDEGTCYMTAEGEGAALWLPTGIKAKG
jgi:hypothetical protein